ncbi:MAG: CHAT domain-containing protein, partial [Flammeovirgaceae bacterium]|nr:CHAT domain-containing protein [Flammeovirgaceae bacterium]
IVLNNTAILYQVIGRYQQAEEYLKKAIAIAEPLQKEKSREHRMLQTNLALLYQQSGRLTEAETYFTTIKKIFENRGQTGLPEYGDVLTQLAVLYIQMKKTDQVETLLKKAQGVYKNKFTEEHPSFARVINIQGNFYRMTGRFNEAETLIDKARQIRETTLGSNHPDYVQSSEDLALVYWKKGLDDKALMLYREVMDKTIDFINHYFPPMSEAEKTNFWDVTSPRFQRFFNFALSAHERGALTLQDFYEYHIATKALLLNSTSKIKQTILKSKDSKLIADYLSWLDQKETLARYYGYSKEELKEQKIDLGALERSANDMEKSLSVRSSDFSSGYSTQKIKFKQVRDLLTDQEAIIEIIRVRNFDQDFTKDVRYAALIVKKGIEAPRLILLSNGLEIETRYATFYRNAIQKKIEDEYSYDQYWSRIEPELTGKKIIYISPDGAYNQINLNSLKKVGADFVLNRYDIVTLGNSKDLIALKSKKVSAARKTASLLGFPDYGSSQISSLPGTKVELDGVSKILKASGYTVNQFVQKEASEKNLKNVKAPSLIHIATHGYFQADVESTSAFGVNLETAGNNPLLRSGLILANAGNALSDSQSPDLYSNDNGILTAYEAMNLDLQGTGLVILSACETGLGEIKSGEGVYGLQRAFQVAGAEALIMSLWKVDDAATQQLMTNFYTNWIKLGNRQKAFKQAQLQLMAKYKDPYYWGAFVMMGM